MNALLNYGDDYVLLLLLSSYDVSSSQRGGDTYVEDGLSIMIVNTGTYTGTIFIQEEKNCRIIF